MPKKLSAARKGGVKLESSSGQPSRKSTRGGKGRTVAAKYLNPDDPSETWTGRGRKPRWLNAKLQEGAKLEKFLIK